MKKALTFVEILVMLAILSILVAMLLPTLSARHKRLQAENVKAEVQALPPFRIEWSKCSIGDPNMWLIVGTNGERILLFEKAAVILRGATNEP